MVALTENNPDAGFTETDPNSLRIAIVNMKQRIESGAILPARLQNRYAANFGPTSLAMQWVNLYAQ
jgi:hypothetical protein